MMFTEAQVAEEFAVSVTTLAGWRCHGKGPKYHKFGRMVGYHSREIERFKLASRHDPSSVRAAKEMGT